MNPSIWIPIYSPIYWGPFSHSLSSIFIYFNKFYPFDIHFSSILAIKFIFHLALEILWPIIELSEKYVQKRKLRANLLKSEITFFTRSKREFWYSLKNHLKQALTLLPKATRSSPALV
jgi:hypothetical protein